MEVEAKELENILIDKYADLIEADPINGLRQSAREAFLEQGLPHKKLEAYKYTPVKRAIEKNFDFSKGSANQSSWTRASCEENFYTNTEANHLVFINGIYHADYSKIQSPSSDLVIEVINSQTYEASDVMKRYFGSLTTNRKDAFAFLNTASFSSGLLLHSKKNTDNLPTYIYHFVDRDSASIATPRVLAIAETGSRLRVYEKTFKSGSENHLTNSLIEAFALANGELRWTKLQDYASNDYAVEGFYGLQEKDSRIYTNTFSFKAGLIRNNLGIDLDAENCETHMHGLYYLNQSSHVDNDTSVDHKMPNSFSNELYKGIIDEKAHAVFNGKIYVRPQAQKTNAFQSNNNILLSDDAKVNTKPQLEIWADDVKCSHGCTTGQLDEEALFYLRSRGISKQNAKALMLNAFASETLQEVTDDHIKEEIENLILNKLGV